MAAQLRKGLQHRLACQIARSEDIQTRLVDDLKHEIRPAKRPDWNRGLHEDRAQVFALTFDLLMTLARDARDLQARIDPRDQFARGERLDQIVVRALLHALDARLFARARGKQHDGYGLCLGIGAEFADQPEAVQVRHHDVREHEIRRVRPRRLQCRAAVGDRFDAPARGEQTGDVGAHVGVVIGDEDSSVGCRRARHGGTLFRESPGQHRARDIRIFWQPTQRLFNVRIDALGRRAGG